MPHIYSTDRLLMAANYTTDALKHPHLDVQFATVGEGAITALSQLALIFKNKFQKPLAPEIVQAPVKAAGNKKTAALVQPILNSPTKHNYQTRSQHVSLIQPANISQSRNSPLLQRVVTPVARHAASPRVLARTHNFLSEICHKTTSGIWEMPIMELHWAPIIGPTFKCQALMYTQSRASK
jgi:hypothetical protein